MLDVSFRQRNKKLFVETHCTIMLRVHIDASNKQFGDAMITNDKQIDFSQIY